MKGFWKDISWIEITIVGAVLIALSALTIPNFHLYSCRAKQSDAKFNLALIYATQQLHHDQFGSYASLGYLQKTHRLKLRSEHYNFTIPILGKNAFLIQAEAVNKASLSGDAWTIDHNNDLQSVFNACQPS